MHISQSEYKKRKLKKRQKTSTRRITLSQAGATQIFYENSLLAHPPMCGIHTSQILIFISLISHSHLCSAIISEKFEELVVLQLTNLRDVVSPAVPLLSSQHCRRCSCCCLCQAFLYQLHLEKGRQLVFSRLYFPLLSSRLSFLFLPFLLIFSNDFCLPALSTSFMYVYFVQLGDLNLFFVVVFVKFAICKTKLTFLCWQALMCWTNANLYQITFVNCMHCGKNLKMISTYMC